MKGSTRISWLAAIAAIAMLAPSCTIVTRRPVEMQPIEKFMSLGGRPRVIAHRGFSGAAPENTMAAFGKAIEIGADMIELDVLLTSDGELIVIHDDTVDRTTGGEGRVASFTLEEIRRLDAGSWFSPEFSSERLPTLAEVLDLVRGKILLNVEIKTEAVTDRTEGGIVEKVVRLVNEMGMRGEVVISSFDARAVRQARELDATFRTAVLYNDNAQSGQSPAAIVRDLDANGFNMSRRQVDADIVKECHAAGFPVAVYTVNDLETMKEMIGIGVDALFTNQPDIMKKLVEEMNP